MIKNNRGRKPIPIIESAPFSKIIFLISAGVNYPQAIAKIRKKDASATIKQLMPLTKKHYLTSKKEKLLNKTIYSVNWYFVIQEFLNFLKEQKQLIFSEIATLNKELEWLKKQLYPYDFSNYDLLENKDFLEEVKQNYYLQEYFKEIFREIGEQKINITIKDFFNFVLMRELFIEILEDMRLFMERIQEKNKDYSDFEKRHEREQEILNNDKDLHNLKQFCDLLYICRKSVILEFANSNAIKKIRDEVLFKHFPKEEVNNFLQWDSEHEQIFNENRYFARARKLFMFDDDYIEFKKNKLKNLKNGINAPKPNKSKLKEDSKK